MRTARAMSVAKMLARPCSHAKGGGGRAKASVRRGAALKGAQPVPALQCSADLCGQLADDRVVGGGEVERLGLLQLAQGDRGPHAGLVDGLVSEEGGAHRRYLLRLELTAGVSAIARHTCSNKRNPL